MKTLLPLCFWYCLAAGPLFATGDSLSYLRPQDTLLVGVWPGGAMYFTHIFCKGQTVYSLARHYGLKQEMLFVCNPGLSQRTTYPDSLPIAIPLPAAAFARFYSEREPGQTYAPLVYRVKFGETLYGIATRNFQIPMDTLMFRNNLPAPALRVGQTLLIGWLSTEGIPDTLQTPDGKQLAPNMQRLFNRFEVEKLQSRTTHQKGAALWLRDLGGQSDYFALHRDARIGSPVRIRNPHTGREAYAKVVGRIQDRRYDQGTIIILSPSIARFLGAADARFFAEIEYFRE